MQIILSPGNAVDVVASTRGVKALDGKIVFPDDWAQSFTYNDDGTLKDQTITDTIVTYKQTYTYSNGKITAVSGWVAQ